MSISLSPCCKEQIVTIENDFYGYGDYLKDGSTIMEVCSFCEKRIPNEDSTPKCGICGSDLEFEAIVIEDFCDFAEFLTQATERRCLHG